MQYHCRWCKDLAHLLLLKNTQKCRMCYFGSLHNPGALYDAVDSVCPAFLQSFLSNALMVEIS